MVPTCALTLVLVGRTVRPLALQAGTCSITTFQQQQHIPLLHSEPQDVNVMMVACSINSMHAAAISKELCGLPQSLTTCCKETGGCLCCPCRPFAAVEVTAELTSHACCRSCH